MSRRLIFGNIVYAYLHVLPVGWSFRFWIFNSAERESVTCSVLISLVPRIPRYIIMNAMIRPRGGSHICYLVLDVVIMWRKSDVLPWVGRTLEHRGARVFSSGKIRSRFRRRCVPRTNLLDDRRPMVSVRLRPARMSEMWTGDANGFGGRIVAATLLAVMYLLGRRRRRRRRLC